MNTYTELIFALADNVAATLRRTPDLDIKSLAKELYVQTFEFNTPDGYQTGTPSTEVDEQGFYDDLVVTMHASW